MEVYRCLNYYLMNGPGLFDKIDVLPGFRYYDEVINVTEEAELLKFAEGLQFQPYVMRGQSSRRGIVRFGFDYGAVGGSHHEVKPFSPELLWLRSIAAERAELKANEFIATVVTCYPPGSTIGWHSDMTQFGPVVFGISLAAACAFKIRPKAGPKNVYNMALEPRSLYVMEGEIRSDWEHSIPPVKRLRYSITFRTVLK